MTIARWDPFRNAVALQERITRLFEDSFAGQAVPDEDLSLCAWKPDVDIYASEEAIVIQADLPGLGKEDVSVEVKENIVMIKGERARKPAVQAEDYYRRERSCGSFQRSFSLPHPVAPDKIRARFKNGVLTIDIPKPEEEVPRQVTVSIE